MALVMSGRLGHTVYAEAMGIIAYEVHLTRDSLQELLLTPPLLDPVVQCMLVLIHLDDDRATLSFNHEVHSNKSLGVLVEPDCELTSKFDPLGLQLTFYAFLMDLDPLAPTTLLMTVASSTVTETSTAQLAD